MYQKLSFYITFLKNKWQSSKLSLCLYKNWPLADCPSMASRKSDRGLHQKSVSRSLPLMKLCQNQSLHYDTGWRRWRRRLEGCVWSKDEMLSGAQKHLAYQIPGISLDPSTKAALRFIDPILSAPNRYLSPEPCWLYRSSCLRWGTRSTPTFLFLKWSKLGCWLTKSHLESPSFNCSIVSWAELLVSNVSCPFLAKGSWEGHS